MKNIYSYELLLNLYKNMHFHIFNCNNIVKKNKNKKN